MTERHWSRHLWWISVFAVAMALLEAAVVVYLRALYYPDGFKFPLTPIDHDLGATEVAREAATLLMLLVPGALIARRALERFAWFCFAFGVWDIFYYFWLKVILDWPATLLEWDILFLIPVPWVGPVIAPCMVSLGLILFATLVLHKRRIDPLFRVAPVEWLLLLVAGIFVLFSFMHDYLSFLHSQSALASAWSIGPGDQATFAHATTYVPDAYDWLSFLAGCGLATVALLRLARRPAR